MEQRAINIAPVFGRSGDLVFWDEDEIVLTRPVLQEVFECFTNDRFTIGSGYPSKVLERVEILLNQNMAHRMSALA
jgi:hypothetical protein